MVSNLVTITTNYFLFIKLVSIYDFLVGIFNLVNVIIIFFL